MGQIHGSRIVRTGSKFMGVLCLCRWLRGSALCKRRVHQGQAPVLLSVPQGCRLEQLREAGGRHHCPDVESVPVLRFSFPFSSHLSPHHLFVFEAASSGDFSSSSVAFPLLSCFSPGLSAQIFLFCLVWSWWTSSFFHSGTARDGV